MAKKISELTKYERARVVGARALQLAMGAPPLVKVPAGLVNAIELARLEFDKNVIPLQVVR
ncbi:MAG: DNA-directed RNA polymerase subunit K [Candidatus Micrarchaeota archaeon]